MVCQTATLRNEEPGALDFRRAAAIAYSAIVISMLAWLAVPCAASGIRADSIFLSRNVPAIWDQGATIADLDGDGRPDLAVVRELSTNLQGSRYRIELHLTSRSRPSSFSVAAETGGLHVAARDIDGDRDLDLIITGARSHRPVGVWINDSHGQFDPADPRAYPPSTWTEASNSVSHVPLRSLRPTAAQTGRSAVASLAGSHAGSKPQPRWNASLADSIFSSPAVGRARPRAPPSRISFQLAI